MDIAAALSEPAVRLIEFHNAFNRNVKVSFGALEAVSAQAQLGGEPVAQVLPTGGEPWGRETRWRDLTVPVKDAAGFLSEIGIVRAVAALEDYLIGAKAEFDRAGLKAVRAKADGTTAMDGFDAVLGVDHDAIKDIAYLMEFFSTARNCVVHRSNRASKRLAELRADENLAETLRRWPKRVGKWTVSLPSVADGQVVEWRPRHAIMASDVCYRCAIALDRQLVLMMGAEKLTGMAAHWCFFADPTAPCHAKRDAGTMVRGQLDRRYKVRSTSLSETIDNLRQIGRWEDVRRAFEKQYPDGPQSSLARKRRAYRAASRR